MASAKRYTLVTSQREDIMQIQNLGKIASVFVVLTMLGGSAFGQSNALKQCRPIGGTVMTNLGVIDENTTLGSATGDLKGALAARIQNIVSNPDGTVSFTVQH